MNVRALLNDLKEVTTSGKSMDELIVLATQAQAIRATYEQSGVEVPEWLDEASRTLRARVTELNRDILEARLRELEQADSALMSRDEKRTANATKIARLRQTLGRPAETASAQTPYIAEPVPA